jgi:hypothetical protein
VKAPGRPLLCESLSATSVAIFAVKAMLLPAFSQA